MALVEDGLLRGFWFRNLVLGVVSVPEQLLALAAPKEFGLGNVRPLRRGGGGQSGAAHDGLNAMFAISVQDDERTAFTFS